MAMATQQATPATDSSVSNALGDMPSGLSVCGTAPTAACRAPAFEASGWGGRFASSSASGSMVTKQMTPTPI